MATSLTQGTQRQTYDAPYIFVVFVRLSRLYNKILLIRPIL